MKVKVKRLKGRNPYHDHPLMRKGGVHEKSEKTKRHIAKQQLKKGEWHKQSNKTILFMPFIKGLVAKLAKPLIVDQVIREFESRLVRQI